MIYCFDLDGTLCTSVENSNYELAEPDVIVINEINRLHEQGDVIKIMTARGCVSNKDYTELTNHQLSIWGVKYNELIMNKKPHANIFIDDRGINISEWKSKIPKKIGIIAGAFDLMHPGYIRMFKECKQYCTNLTVALHVDPSLERAKLSPVQELLERYEILSAIKYIDDVVVYSTEEDLVSIIPDYDIRFLGDDYKDRIYTGYDLPIEVHFLNRGHGYSTTKLKEKIYYSMKDWGL